MNILVIDGQGGGVGKQVVAAVKNAFPAHPITAVGTNSIASAAMLKAGADHAAVGENAVIVGCRKADIIIGPIGIAIADSLLGEITPQMALAVGQSQAKRFLIPINHCDNIIVGVADLKITVLIEKLLEALQKELPDT